MLHLVDSFSNSSCQIIGMGHSDPLDAPGAFEIVSQREFLDRLPLEKQAEICKNGLSLDEVAVKWSEMISERRTFFKDDITELAYLAVHKCLNRAATRHKDFSLSKIDAIIGATNTGSGYPSLADKIKRRIGVKDWGAMCFDVTEACVSGNMALFQGYNLIKSGACRNVLVVCAEKATTLTDLNNWQGSNLFGDASFAVLLGASAYNGFRYFYFDSLPFDGGLDYIRKVDGGFQQDGGKVHAYVVGKIPKIIKDSLEKSGLRPEQIKHLVFHQPSNKTLTSLEEKLRQDGFTGIFHRSKDIGNASSASFGNLLSLKIHSGEIKPRESVLVCTFGAGLSIGITMLLAPDFL